jgi:hypothetical protein
MGLSRRVSCLASAVVVFLSVTAVRAAGTWDGAASELARKIVMHTAPRAAINLEVRNQSSLTENEVAEISRSVRTQLRGQGTRIARTGRPQVQVVITLSENLQTYLWVAEIRRRGTQEVVMVQVARPPAENPSEHPEMLELRKTLLYEQQNPILDLATFDAPGAAEPSLLVLDLERVAVYKKRETHWTLEKSLPLTRARPWPRDARGRLVIRDSGQFDAYTPGTRCQGSTFPVLTLECRDSDDPWPIGSGDSADTSAHFDADRNYFDGKLTLQGGETQVPAFFSAATIPGTSDTSRIFADLDGRVRIFDKGPEPAATFDGWGSDIASIQSGCGSGWQVLATGAGSLTDADAIQAYSLRDRSAVQASAPVEFPGPVTALWPAAAGRSALAVARNLKTGMYEAFTLSITCSQ